MKSKLSQFGIDFEKLRKFLKEDPMAAELGAKVETLFVLRNSP